MEKWLVLLATGCLIVGEPGDDEALSTHILPIGTVHPCRIEIIDLGTALWNVCFGSPSHIAAFEREMVAGCSANGHDCDVQCSSQNIHPCVLACPGTGLSRGCNATHGCYCPHD